MKNLIIKLKYFCFLLRKTRKKKEDRLKPMSFEIGSIDNLGNLVILPIIQLEEFIIYVNDSGEIILDLNDDYIYEKNKGNGKLVISENNELIRNLNKIASRFAYIKSLEPQRVRKSSIYRLIARAIASGLLGDISTSMKIFDLAENRLLSHRISKGRVEYLTGAFIAVFSFFILFLCENIFSFMPKDWLIYLRVFLGGAIGGQLSVAIRTRSIYVDLEASSFANIIGGFGRVIIAMLSSLVVYFAFQLDLIFANFSSNDVLIPAVSLISVIAGFSEQLVPSLIKRLSDSGTTTNSINNSNNSSDNLEEAKKEGQKEAEQEA